MKGTNKLLKDINGLMKGIGESKTVSEKAAANRAVASLASAVKKLKAESDLKRARLDAKSEADKELLRQNVGSAVKQNAENKADIDASARKAARKTSLKNVYNGITGKEAEDDGLDILERALNEKGIKDKELKETVWSLEQKAAAEEKARAEERKRIDEEGKASKQKLIDDTKVKLEEIKTKLSAEQLDKDINNKLEQGGSLTDKEIETLCNNLIKNATYRGTAYKSLLKREFLIMKESGMFTDYDIERVRKLLYLENEEDLY